MAEDDIYKSKARYESFKENLESYLVKPISKGKITIPKLTKKYLRNKKINEVVRVNMYKELSINCKPTLEIESAVNRRNSESIKLITPAERDAPISSKTSYRK